MADDTNERGPRGSNPALKPGLFSRLERREGDGVMTMVGAVHKTGILLLLLAAGFALTYAPTLNAVENPWLVALIPVLLINLVLAFVIIFFKRSAPFIAPIYAFGEGLLLGCLSAMLESKFPGIAFQAAGLTFGVLAVLLGVYATGLVKVTEKFRLGVIAATGGIMVVYLIDMVLSFFGHRVPMVHETGWLGIGFSLVVVGVAAANLLLDFDFIEQGALQEAPKYMEWYSAFSLLLTLIWLYLEILRLLGKLRER